MPINSRVKDKAQRLNLASSKSQPKAETKHLVFTNVSRPQQIGKSGGHQRTEFWQMKMISRRKAKWPKTNGNLEGNTNLTNPKNGIGEPK